MSIENMAAAAQASNPVEFNKAFKSEIFTRLAEAISLARQDVVSEMFDLQTESEDAEMYRILESMTNEELEEIIEGDFGKYVKTSTKGGSLTGAVGGATTGAMVGSVSPGIGTATGASKVVDGVGHGIKKVAQGAKRVLTGRKAR